MSPLCSLLPSAVVVSGCGLNGYLNTAPHRVFGSTREFLPFIVLEEHTREVTAMYQEVP